MKKFRLIIAGTRTFTDYEFFLEQIRYVIRHTDHDDIEIVSGGCIYGIVTFVRDDGTKVCGADGLGERFAKQMGFPVKLFSANWNKHGKKAGVLRNEEMAQYATNCIVFWDNKSKGSRDMIERAEKYNLHGTVIDFTQHDTN